MTTVTTPEERMKNIGRLATPLPVMLVLIQNPTNMFVIHTDTVEQVLHHFEDWIITCLIPDLAQVSYHSSDYPMMYHIAFPHQSIPIGNLFVEGKKTLCRVMHPWTSFDFSLRFM